MTTEELTQLRQIIREEVEAEAKITRRENAATGVRLEARLVKVEDRLKNVEIDLSATRKTAETTEMKVEVVNKRVATAEDNVKKIIEKEAETTADFFHETWAKLEATTE